jgi:hypothetical protein
MLGKWPIPNKLSKMPAQAGGLWIRRVLVRAQEGQWPVREAPAVFIGARPGGLSPGGATRQAGITYVVSAFRVRV